MARPRLDQLDATKLSWLNRQFADRLRSLRRIRERLDERGFDREEEIYRAIVTALDALVTVCALTHRRLKSLRPGLPDNYKPSAYMRQRYGQLEADEKERERRELGR